MNAAARASIGRSIAMRSMLEPSCTPWQLVWSSMYWACSGSTIAAPWASRITSGLICARDGEMALAARGRVLERRAAGVAGRAAGGDAGVEDEDVGRRLLHQPPRVVLVEGIADGQHVELAGGLQHVELVLVAEPGRFERAAELAVEPGDGRKIVHAGDADPAQILEEARACRAADRRR